MNAVLLIFMILAALFIASSINNIVAVATALDSYFEKAKVPDHLFMMTDEAEAERFSDFAKEEDYSFQSVRVIQADPKEIWVGGERLDYGNTVCLSSVGGTKVFDSDSREITQVSEGEIYVTADVFSNVQNDFHEGCKIVIGSGGKRKEFTLKGYDKDVLFGSPMVGMTRLLISEKDWTFFQKGQASVAYMFFVYTDSGSYQKEFNDQDFSTVFNSERSAFKMVYLMDMLIAVVMLIVSICLILISMIILHFTIGFTISEEYREIGVMKAIGISNPRIRGLYIVKYLAVSVVASLVGLALSAPFSSLMLDRVSRNMILNGKSHFYLNVFCVAGTAAAVVLFCYFCTRKIRKFSPVDAIRSGETGERYKRKSILRLSRSRVSPVIFMAANDILSGLRRYVSMMIIFTLGILLIIIPTNAINTLRSDRLITWFNMAESDHVIMEETLLFRGGNNRERIEQGLARVTVKRRYALSEIVDGDIRLDANRKTVSAGGVPMAVTGKEFELLKLLMENKGRVLSKEYLFRTVWGSDSVSGPQTLTVHIKWLRQKIESDPKKPQKILTVWGVGYRYV